MNLPITITSKSGFQFSIEIFDQKNLHNSEIELQIISVLDESFNELGSRTNFYENNSFQQTVKRLSRTGIIALQRHKNENEKEKNIVLGAIFYSHKSGEANLLGIGPFGVHSKYQNQGIGKNLFKVLIEMIGKDFESLRLCVNTHNPSAFALYLKMGFEIKESLILLKFIPRNDMKQVKLNNKDEYQVEKMKESDLKKCYQYIKLKVGYYVEIDITDECFIVFNKKKEICGVTTGLSIRKYTIIDSLECFQVLLLSQIQMKQKNDNEIKLLISTNYPELIKYLLSIGSKIGKSMFWMSKGKYQPCNHGIFIPKIEGCF